MTFQIGDTVMVRSGGPRMTVERIDGDQVYCVWFEKTKAHRGSFSSGVLIVPQPRRPIVGVFGTRW